MFWFKKKDLKEHNLGDHNKRERLFFHDIINQTHGLILFFNQRQSINKVISVEEIKMLEKEVRTLQSLIKDHFQYKHKNLPNTYDWVPFSIAEIAVKSLIQTYLPAETVQTFIHKDFKEDETSVVYFPVFYRIFNNLIKNMSEAKTNEVHIHFQFNESGLTIETRNQNNSNQELKKISDELSQLILDKNFSNKAGGLGLESIHHLALECGGKFESEISNNCWINRIFLPGPSITTQVIEQKKAV
ncbi:MAG: GHKL domain-containing protein [Bacteriovorax sp.]|nr:GHKL domain-containing protein [Bacteriovorax sp.]